MGEDFPSVFRHHMELASRAETEENASFQGDTPVTHFIALKGAPSGFVTENPNRQPLLRYALRGRVILSDTTWYNRTQINLVFENDNHLYPVLSDNEYLLSDDSLQVISLWVKDQVEGDYLNKFVKSIIKNILGIQRLLCQIEYCSLRQRSHGPPRVGCLRSLCRKENSCSWCHGTRIFSDLKSSIERLDSFGKVGGINYDQSLDPLYRTYRASVSRLRIPLLEIIQNDRFLVLFTTITGELLFRDLRRRISAHLARKAHYPAGFQIELGFLFREQHLYAAPAHDLDLQIQYANADQIVVLPTIISCLDSTRGTDKRSSYVQVEFRLFHFSILSKILNQF